MNINPKMKVVFRKCKDGSILALFPELTNLHNSTLCMSYQTIGQHSEAHYEHCIKTTVRTNIDEIITLKRELERIGYNLKVRMKK